MRGICSVDGCGRNQNGLGYCSSHYRHFKAGQPLGPIKAKLRDGCTAAESLAHYSPTLSEDECWPWGGAIAKNGYGLMKAKGVTCLAHRMAWELANDRTLRPNEVVMHDCDNRPCVNPSHLQVGTQKKNLGDMVERGRSSRGERSGHAKFTAEMILEVRARSAAGERHCHIARDLGISAPHVTTIVKRRTWKHI